MTDPVCVISGVGPGTGSALARRFAAGGYRVAMLARNPQRLAELERELPDCKGYACDVSDAAQVEATANRIERDLGVPTTLVHNAVGGAFGSFLEIDPAVLNRNFQVNTMGLLYLARRLAPAMISAGSGNVIVTGNTSALRGRAVLRRVRTNQGRAANSGRSHGPRTWAEGSACCLHYYRCCDRRPLDARALQGQSPTTSSSSLPPSPRRRGI